MAKKRGKKLIGQGPSIKRSNKRIRKRSMKNNGKSEINVASASFEDPLTPSTTMPVSVITPTVVETVSATPAVTPTVVVTTSAVASHNKAKQGKEEEKEDTEQSPGFIFMCNGITKPGCYRNRVFGLPKGQVELVQKIKLGAMLFLFDFDSKLLYGVYEATSKGELGLEPGAFNGKFPAQVRFKIFKECLPLPEKAFKHAIKDNYQGFKFRQDLTKKQVKTLISLFHPLTTPTTVTAAPALANVVTRQICPVPVMNERFQQPARPFPANDSYLHGVPYGNAFPSPVIPSDQVFQQSVLRHCVDLHNLMGAHQPYMPEEPSLFAQDQYGRNGPTAGVVQGNQVTQYENEHHSSELAGKIEVFQQLANFSTNLPPASASQVSLQTHARKDLLSAYQPSYPVTFNANLHQLHVDSSEAGRTGEVQHSGNLVGYYSQNQPQASASHALLQRHELRDLLSSYKPHYSATTSQLLHQPYHTRNLLPASATHFPLQTHAQNNLVSYQPHYPVITNNDPLQRPVYGSSSSAVASLPNTAPCYIAGPATAYPTYR